eukprot:15367193-Ditylum_brightwellii.AAC.3
MVLNGEFNTEELDKVLKLFIHHCKVEPTENLIGTKITKDQWKGKVVMWCKSTTTSPSGRHLGHFKVLICRFKESPEIEEGREMYQKRNT